MTDYREVLEKDQKQWDEVVNHPLQSWGWGEFRKERQPVVRIGKYQNGKLKAGFLVMWTKIPLLPYYFGYVPMSVFPNRQDTKELKAICRIYKGIGIRFEPLSSVGNEEKPKELQRSRGLFKNKTYLWDLSKSEEELMGRMHPKCRYNIRLAQKRGVVIEENNLAVEEYINLLFGSTAKRQKVGMHNRQYQSRMFEVLHKAGMAKLFVAKYKEQILAAMVVYRFRKWVYYAYGASSMVHKEVMAPTLLVWEVARRMKSEGYGVFDLWGGEEGKGFSRFKEQFGADSSQLPGAFDLVANRGGYVLFRIAEEVRWWIRHH